MLKVYISGRIKDYDGYKEHFAREQEVLEQMGYTVVNPCLLGHPSFTYEEFMKVDISALIDCDIIYMLDDWEISAGARCEHLVAVFCGLKVYYESAKPLNFSA